MPATLTAPMFTVRCPNCRATNCHRSRRVLVRALSRVTGVRRYTCASCYRRFWRPWPLWRPAVAVR